METFYIVGIGASAGGHVALKEFFSRISPNPGVAFCVITHLSRSHRSILDTLLSRYTSLTVKRMQDKDVVRPNVVYVMPEGVTARIKNGCILLDARTPHDVVNRTIDEFFLSLAVDQQENAVGIVFSGMGDDGTRGLKLIHDMDGHVLVQDPDSTQFRSMPENAIAKDHPQQILPPSLLAASLMSYISGKKVPNEKR